MVRPAEIPCRLIRGGSSRGAYFLADDLPTDPTERDRLLLRIMGGPDALQVNGIGGGHPLTSKVAIIAPSHDPKADVDFLFLQIDPSRQTVSGAQNCGNILSGVGVFALDTNMVQASDHETRIRVRLLNSGALCHLLLQTPQGHYCPQGDIVIDGVPGSGSPIVCEYQDIAGSSCGSLLPTDNIIDNVCGIETTCVDNGMPMVIMRAIDFGLSGIETPEALEANDTLTTHLQEIRLTIAPRMNLGDVSEKSVPKMCLVSPPQSGGAIMTRTFIPHACHRSIGVLGAVSVATACLLPGSTAHSLANIPANGAQVLNGPQVLNIEHPAGALGVHLTRDKHGQVLNAGVARTARLLFRGEVMP